MSGFLEAEGAESVQLIIDTSKMTKAELDLLSVTCSGASVFIDGAIPARCLSREVTYPPATAGPGAGSGRCEHCGAAGNGGHGGGCPNGSAGLAGERGGDAPGWRTGQ